MAFDGGRSSYGAIEYIAANKDMILNVLIVIAGKDGSRGNKTVHTPRMY